MTHWRKYLPVLLVVLVFTSLTLPGAFAQGSSLQVQTPLEKALAGVVFLSDLYNPNPNAPSAGPGGIVLNEAITGFGLDVSTIAGGHGGTIAFEDFEASLGQ